MNCAQKLALLIAASVILGGCVNSSSKAPVSTGAGGISLGAAPGKTAIETTAAMPLAAAKAVFGRYADPSMPRNEAGELELLTSAANKDKIMSIKAAAAKMCAGAELALIGVEELPRDKNGVRKFKVRCK